MKTDIGVRIATIALVMLLVPLVFSGAAADKRDATVKNFGKVNDNYYRGGQPGAKHFSALKAAGIRTIVNLRKNGPKEEEGLARQAGMNYFYLPLSSRKPATPAEVDEFLKIVNDPDNWPVYVHCAAGRHRTGGMTAVYRMTHDGWDADKAFEEMDKYGFYSFPNHGSWKKFVYEYHSATADLYPDDTDEPEPAETRMETIERRQREKAAALAPAGPDKVEAILERHIGDDPMNKYVGGVPGLHLRFGGLPSGAGFALGLEYKRPDLRDGLMMFRASAAGSTNLWHGLETELGFPRIGGRFLDVSFLARRVDATSIDYYGPGEDSREDAESDYHREENSFEGTLTFKPTRRHLKFGLTAGYRLFNTGPGDEGGGRMEALFTPEDAPGIDHQAHYLKLSPFVDIDSRDKPNDPHTGTHFLLQFDRFDDRKHDRYSFQRVNGSLEHYIPFFNEKRVVALRAATVLSYADAGDAVPFYLQPTLGGSSDLRGYSRYRFYDDNMFVTSAEYRWEIFTLLDAALFADAGKVFHRDRDFSFDKMEIDGGFGFRFKTRDAVAFRVDTAFSREGYGLWFAFNHVF
ncbi:MAG: BamA/TamA family outer membrane protein [Acidobacteriota bacterium]|jgi:protein tyrosine phosphatase (PTP) superfamily phosphohydrolase (DUF442 family)|nr:BamA/TamA family outer membrane protein [Acidobacteriota bacterium]